MKVKVQVVIESDEGAAEIVENVIHIERGTLCPEDLGLTLSEARELLRNVQDIMVKRQVAQFLPRHASCPECGEK